MSKTFNISYPRCFSQFFSVQFSGVLVNIFCMECELVLGLKIDWDTRKDFLKKLEELNKENKGGRF